MIGLTSPPKSASFLTYMGISNHRCAMVTSTFNVGAFNEENSPYFAIVKSKEIMKTKILSVEKLNMSYRKFQIKYVRKPEFEHSGE